MRFIFYKKAIAWPFQSGHDVHTFQMMRALREAGHAVGLVTTQRPAVEVLDRLVPDFEATLNGAPRSRAAVAFGRAEEHFRSYWGVPTHHAADLQHIARGFRADAVVVSGLEVLPMLCGIEGALRVWYAADEWVWHHCSQLRLTDRRSWSNLREAAVKGLYERTFANRLDRAWVVSASDRRALRCVTGLSRIDVLPNGIDADHYRPQHAAEEPHTAIFWGRLDFGPNIQALEWFCTRVWPLVRRERPQARFSILGFKLTPPVAALGALPGVTIAPDVADLRSDIARHAVVVLPFVSGGGIKNKLLEAAAMGKAVVSTPHALGGTQRGNHVAMARTPRQWAGALMRLWDDDAARRDLGARARDWVVREHTWAAAAATALAGIEESLGAGGRS